VPHRGSSLLVEEFQRDALGQNRIPSRRVAICVLLSLVGEEGVEDDILSALFDATVNVSADEVISGR
jgi:hypothetical protein